MANPMDWRTRLAVSYTDKSTNTTVNITPIDSFTPSFSLNAEALHSIERTHVGAVFSPKSITFSLTVKAIGDVAAQLTALAFAGTRFDITLQENLGGDWSFKTLVMSDCIITSATPTTATTTGAPSATFSGFSMASTMDAKNTSIGKSGSASVP